MLPPERRRADDAELIRRLARTQGPVGPCPDANALAAFLDGSVVESDREPIEQHVADCHACQEVVAA